MDGLRLEQTSFVGRRRELAEIVQALGWTRLLTLTGPGGAGKTRLAYEAAARLASSYPDGVQAVELASLSRPELVAQAVASVLDVPLPETGTAEVALARQLAERRLLLVLDNCEHLLDACARLAAALLPVLYPPGEAFPVGGAKVLRSSDHDEVTLVGAGVTLHACLGAADLLAEEGISARVVDCYSVKAVDAATLAAAVDATGGRIVVAEDHRPEGGLGSAVTDALLALGRSNLALAHQAVAGPPGSGSGAELLAWAGLDADHIAAAARKLIGTD
jgi:hypothetical protein